MPSLRKYQQEDVDTLRETLRGGAKKVLFEASVGYGKSVVIEHLAAAYSSAGRKVWVLSNRSAVVNQLRSRAGGMPGVEVMTVQAADRRRERLAADPATLILVDEVHMGGAAAQYRRVLDCAPGAVAIGFTGTPRPETFEVFPAHVQGRGAAWLTEKGFLAPLRYRIPHTPDLAGVGERNGDYIPADLVNAIERSETYGSIVDTYAEFCRGEPTLGFCVNVAEAHRLAEKMSDAGFKPEVLTGQDKQEDVDRRIAHLADGGLLLSVDKVSAGFDLPDLRHLLLARPTKSPQLHNQQLGRAARASDGKTHGMIHDHSGNCQRLGTLTEDRDWRGGDRKPDNELTENGERLGLRRCDGCKLLYEGRGSICPHCGHENGQDRRLSVRESVELREQTAADIEAQRRAVKNARARAGQTVKQRAGFLHHKQRVPWPEARRRAIEKVRGVLDQARKKGDAQVIEIVEDDLRSIGAA